MRELLRHQPEPLLLLHAQSLLLQSQSLPAALALAERQVLQEVHGHLDAFYLAELGGPLRWLVALLEDLVLRSKCR